MENLQVEFDDQLLRLTELQEQYEFKCNEVGVCTVHIHVCANSLSL